MVLPPELAHLDPAIVQLLFETLTEQGAFLEHGSYDATTLRHHIITLTEHGYVLSDRESAAGSPQLHSPRCLTIKGYILLSMLNQEQSRGGSLRIVERWHDGGHRMTGT